jgi:thiamine kinase-like enzyme
MKRYHESTGLKRVLAHGRTSNGVEHAQMELAVLLRKFDASRSGIVRNTSTSSGLRLLAIMIACIPVDVVPTHGDPNPSNFIVANDGIVMVDWDGITLADRWRDISLVLWRYVDRARWREFFSAYGVRFGCVEQERFYWWLAHGALTIAIWFVGRGDQAQAQLHMSDFLSAVSRLRALASRGAKR